MTGGPLLIAHRAGNAPGDVAPAVRAGADLVEVDVHLRRGVLEVRHPRRLGPVTWERAGIRRAPARPVRLEDVLARLPAGAGAMLDLKQGPADLPRAALAAWRARGGGPVTVSSRRWSLVDAIAGEEDVRPVHSAAGRRELERLLRRPVAPRTVCARRDLLDAGAVARILGVAERLFTWPVDDPADAALLAGWGVGGLICDDLGLVARLAGGQPDPSPGDD
ncbi:MAG: glycerophosphodiester phosphodiesterase [Thermoleophilia bacterium]